MKTALLGLAFLTVATPAWAGLPFICRDCGCTNTRKVCRLVPEVKKETVTKYIVECEDICIPAPSERCGPACLLCTLPCPCLHRKTTWQPVCGEAITRKKYKKEVVVEEKPGYKCVVETVCGKCGSCCCEPGAARP